LFNHESPIRGETFVTRKITRAVAAIERGIQKKLRLGNLDARRDWGHARDYVEGMWRILQQDEPDDFVLATGETHTVREFVEKAFAVVDRRIEWTGRGVDEKGIDARSGEELIEIDPRYFRPNEVDFLLGDATKARTRLGWTHRVPFEALVSEMVEADLRAVMREVGRNDFEGYCSRGDARGQARLGGRPHRAGRVRHCASARPGRLPYPRSDPRGTGPHAP